MSLSKLKNILSEYLDALKGAGSLKGQEMVITGVIGPQGDNGPRYLIEGYRDKKYIRMNSNNYLGLALRKEVIEAEAEAANKYGAGPGSVRFISGTFQPHVELEQELAKFHDREAGMIFSSAYATVMGTLMPLISADTVIISDELNHNSIINAIRLSQPKGKMIYKHNNMNELESALQKCVGGCSRVLIITDGIFSMRGDNAPLPQIAALAEKYEDEFKEGIITVVDDSHGVGTVAETGRGTTELTHEYKIDILISTLGKALGVNGGYLVSDKTVINYLREVSPFYIYSNPISASEANAALEAIRILNSDSGRRLLRHLHEITVYFRQCLINLGYEIIDGVHPIVPLMVRDTDKTTDIVQYLKDKGILTTGIYYPVVPKGDEEIRFQICADHTISDINYVVQTLKVYQETH